MNEMIFCLAGLAGAAAGRGQLQRAARMFGAVEALMEAAELRWQPVDRVEFDRNLAIVREGITQTVFDEAWAAGRAMPLEEIIEEALAEEPGRSPTLDIRMLGAFEVRKGQSVIPSTAWRRRRDRLLLAYLLVAREPASRETLLEALWPDLTPASASASLNVAWSNLKRALEPKLPEGQSSAYLLIDSGRRSLNWALIATDVQEFEEHIAAAEKAVTLDTRVSQLEAAATLYRGDLLFEDINEPWTVVERERLRLAYLTVLEQLAEGRTQQGRGRDAVETLQAILRLEPWREEAYRSLMRLLGGMGRRSEAVRLYRQCEELLRRELNVPPSPETKAVFDAIATSQPVHSVSPPPDPPATP